MIHVKSVKAERVRDRAFPVSVLIAICVANISIVSDVKVVTLVIAFLRQWPNRLFIVTSAIEQSIPRINPLVTYK